MQRKKNRKWLFWAGGGLVVLVIAAVLVVNGRAQQAQTATNAGEIVTAFMGDLESSATASGQVTARREASLSVETPGRVEQVLVREGDAVKAGETLVQLDITNLAFNLANAQQTLRLQEASLADLQADPETVDVASAEAAVKSAQANLDDLLDGPSAEELAASEASLRSAQASVASASANLGSVQDSIKESQILAAQASLLAAQRQLDSAQEADDKQPTEATYQALMEANEAVASAQADLDSLQEGPDATAAQGSLNAAVSRLDGSQANYNLTADGATDVQLASAKSQLAQAQANLANLVDPPTDEELAVAEANVAQAQLAVQDAEAALAAATIVAPFDGVVTAVHANIGEIASGSVVELVDSSSLQVVLQVDEVDVGDLSVGQPAAVTLETWPDTTIDSEITTIAPSAQTSSALITYDVYLSLGQTDLPVRVGMTADARLITASYSDVLLVPNRAINADREKGTYSVNLVVGDAVQEVPVTIDARDDQNTRITSGLNAGDNILIGDNLPTISFGPGAENNGQNRPAPFGG
ncbi:MAG: efflux RND transporter periplasmic adaptor subunit [Ardenticatenaceae bacterium]|nr:efflux RND transporter periplasmic adaptor subunit [Ardenticatenaceae bacterium]